jgi:hypothetical protein
MPFTSIPCESLSRRPEPQERPLPADETARRSGRLDGRDLRLLELVKQTPAASPAFPQFLLGLSRCNSRDRVSNAASIADLNRS